MVTDAIPIGPISLRDHGMDGECHNTVGHKHNYDHVTLIEVGEIDVSLLADDGLTVEESRSLRVLPIDPANDGRYACGGLLLQRVNVLPGAKVNIPPSSVAATVFVLQGFADVKHSNVGGDRMKDGRLQCPAGEHLIISADVAISIESSHGTQVMIVSPYLPGRILGSISEVREAGDFCLVEAGRHHRVECRSNLARYGCIYPHRTFEGVVVESYAASRRNVAAYT